MALDLLLDTTGNLVVSGGDLQLAAGAAAIKQNVSQALQLTLGEWFLDTTAGMDTFGVILIKNANPNLVRTVIERTITGVDGIAELLRLDLDYDKRSRELSVSWAATTVDDTKISDSQNLSVTTGANVANAGAGIPFGPDVPNDSGDHVNFTLSHKPLAGTFQLFRNGILATAYMLSPTAASFALTGPAFDPSSETLVAFYSY